MKKVYKLHAEREIAVSHTLNLHEGKCQRPHGHNFTVIVDVESDRLICGGSSDGMIIDFGDIKRAIDSLDHEHLNEVFKDNIYLAEQPTAERVAEYLADYINEVASEENYLNFISVKVYETSNQYAEVVLKA